VPEPIPFRWDVSRREQLGRLIDGWPTEPDAEFLRHLLQGCARIAAMSDDANLVFVGRSPENYFDHLSGLLAGSSWADRLALLNVSLRGPIRGGHPSPAAVAAFRAQLEALGLAPAHLVRRARPVAFVDMVATGATLGRLVAFLLDWARETGIGPAPVRRRLRFVGLTLQTRTSPTTLRWHQHAAWTRDFPARAVRNVSVPPRIIGFLANVQIKTMPSNPPHRWGAEFLRRPSRWKGRLAALAFAHCLYTLGTARERRRAFAQALARQPAMRHAWFRGLAMELREGRRRPDR
jgi:hypothetical protein